MRVLRWDCRLINLITIKLKIKWEGELLRLNYDNKYVVNITHNSAYYTPNQICGGRYTLHERKFEEWANFHSLYPNRKSTH